MQTRECARCGEAKSVAGVWYLVNSGADRFVCGACFSQTKQPASAGPA